jgi:hypothetical protein
MDDFFVRPHGKRPLSPPQLHALHQRIERTLPERTHGRLWVVLYDRDVNGANFDTKFAPWLKEVDGITLWFAGQHPLRRSTMEKTLAKLQWKVARYPRRPQILLGCYMWRYLERKHGEIARDKMDTQLEFAREHLANGSVAGLIFLGSPIVSTAADSPSRDNVLAVKNWIDAHRDDLIGKH